MVRMTCPLFFAAFAVTVERIEGAQLRDLVGHNETTEDGDWFDLTVSYSLPNEQA